MSLNTRLIILKKTKAKVANWSIAKVASLLIAPLLFISIPILAHAKSHKNGCNLPKSYYKNVRCTSDSRYFLAVKDSGKPVALLDKSGKESANLTKYQDVMENIIHDGLIPVMKNGKVGYINGKGVVAVPAVYDSLGGASWARAFSDSRAVVKKKGNWGVINTANKVIVPFSSRIDTISDFSNKTAEIVKSGKLYTVSTSGSMNLVSPASSKRPSKAPKKKQSSSTKKITAKKSVRKSIQQNPSAIKTKNVNNVKKVLPSNKKSTIITKAKNRKPQIIRPKKVIKKNTEISLSDDKIIDLLQDYKLLTPDSRLYQGNKEVMLNKKEISNISQIKEPFSVKNTLIDELVNDETPSKSHAKTPNNHIKANRTKIVRNSNTPYPSSGSKSNLSLQPVSSKVPTDIQENTLTKKRKMFPNSKNGKWGFVDMHGVDMITHVFDEVVPFSNELAGVKIDGNWGFINKAGDLVINFLFSEKGIIRDGHSYRGMPPFIFFDGKAWIGNLTNGDKICIDIHGENISCS